MLKHSSAIRLHRDLGRVCHCPFGLARACAGPVATVQRVRPGETTTSSFAVRAVPESAILRRQRQLRIIGTVIDSAQDLGLERKNSELRLVLRPGETAQVPLRVHSDRLAQTHTLQKDIIFNGIKYRIGLPVESTIDWKAYRFAYELDVVSVSRGFAGLVIEAKYTDVHVDLVSAIATEFANARAPIPAIGGIGRVYIVPKVSITGEFTAFKLPKNLVKDTSAHYVDFDLYGTMNFTKNVGAQFGYRSLDVGYLRDTDTGLFTEKGVYFGVVARY